MSSLVVFSISLAGAVLVGVVRSIALAQRHGTRTAAPVTPRTAAKRAPRRVETGLEQAA